MRASICMLAFVLGAAGLARAGEHDFVVEHSGIGGSAEEAAPYIDKFLRYVERRLDWPAGSATGQFFSAPTPAVAYIEHKRPGFGMLDPSLWLELHDKAPMQLLASVSGKNQTLGHYSVVVKSPAYKTLADLKGKTLVSNHLESPRFLSKIAFAGKLDAARFFKLEPTASPLKGLRAVARGEAEATLLDDDQLAHMKSLPFASELRVLYTSPALPPMPLVAFTKNSTPRTRAAFSKMLFAMCGDAEGAAVCKSLQITKFSPPDKAAYDTALKRFEK